MGGAPKSITVGDFNGDGHPDWPPPLTMAPCRFTRPGDGTFEATSFLGLGGTPFSIAVGDFNVDGHLDLAAAMLSTR